MVRLGVFSSKQSKHEHHKTKNYQISQNREKYQITYKQYLFKHQIGIRTNSIIARYHFPPIKCCLAIILKFKSIFLIRSKTIRRASI